MQYKAKTPDEYLEVQENDWRKSKLNQVREIIRRLGPNLNEGIEYKMLAYSMGEKNVFHLNVQQSYVSLYVGNINKIEKAAEFLKEFDKGKGCIRIKKNVEISETNLDKFIKEAIDLCENGGNTDC